MTEHGLVKLITDETHVSNCAILLPDERTPWPVPLASKVALAQTRFLPTSQEYTLLYLYIKLRYVNYPTWPSSRQNLVAALSCSLISTLARFVPLHEEFVLLPRSS